MTSQRANPNFVALKIFESRYWALHLMYTMVQHVQYLGDDSALLLTANKITFLKMPCTLFGIAAVFSTSKLVLFSTRQLSTQKSQADFLLLLILPFEVDIVQHKLDFSYWLIMFGCRLGHLHKQQVVIQKPL